MGIVMAGCWRVKGPIEVDVLEDDAARVVSPATGRSWDVPRSSLPPGVKEGDVVVDGRVDPALTAALRTDVERARERLHKVPVSGAVDLDELPAAANPQAMASEPPSSR